MNALDRDKAREVLVRVYKASVPDAVLDALEGCVRPVPATIDRDALDALLDSMVGPLHRGVLAADRILALVRPVDCVTLTPEEAQLAARALRTGLGTRTPAETYRARVALADRLEASA